jgi:hypothetical protein
MNVFHEMMLSYKRILCQHDLRGEFRRMTGVKEETFEAMMKEKGNKIKHKKSYSKYLFEILSDIYDGLKFKEVKDEIFKEITIARIIEPSSLLTLGKTSRFISCLRRITNLQGL